MSWLKTSFLRAVGSVIDGIGVLDGAATHIVVNRAVGSSRTRPHPWSTYAPYITWDGLTDRHYLARHLPPAELTGLPAIADVQKLFQRPPGGQRLSTKSTCLFPAFAQYLTDGFIRTVPTNTAMTTTNHDIDLCPLYGRTRAQTMALRLRDNTAGRRGRLKSQMIGQEEFAPFLFEADGRTIKAEFAELDPPLLVFQQTNPPTQPWPPADAHAATLFAFGGDRANGTPFTAMLNTLLLREHNRLAGELDTGNPGWDDERVFQTARNILIVIYIKLVVEEYINHITPLPFSIGADPSVAWTANWNRPNWITVEFSLLYRWHSALPDTVAWDGGAIDMARFQRDNAPLLAVGLTRAFEIAASQPAGEIGAFNTAVPLMPIEIASIAQARRNKVASYNDYREAFGMARAASFDEITSKPEAQALLQTLYGTPDQVEFYPGLFAEDLFDKSPLPALLLGMVAVDAFSQALTNPLLSEHVWTQADPAKNWPDAFTSWGRGEIERTHKLRDLLERNCGATPPSGAVEMTQASWSY